MLIFKVRCLNRCDRRIQLVQIEPRLVAAHVYSGFWSEAKNKSLANELFEWINKNTEYKITSEPMFAGYNPPWTIPFFRRNEMLVEIKETMKK